MEVIILSPDVLQICEAIDASPENAKELLPVLADALEDMGDSRVEVFRWNAFGNVFWPVCERTRRIDREELYWWYRINNNGQLSKADEIPNPYFHKLEDYDSWSSWAKEGRGYKKLSAALLSLAAVLVPVPIGENAMKE